MGRQKVNTTFYAATATFIAIAALLMATTAYARASGGGSIPPCYNRVQDVGEAGVDCGGSCASPSLIEFCDGKDNDQDCVVDEECKNWSSGNTSSLDGLGASGKAGEGGGNAQGPPPGYQSYKIPQPIAESGSDSGSGSPPFSAEVQPSQRAPEPVNSAPQSSLADDDASVPIGVPVESSQGLADVNESSALPERADEQKANKTIPVNEKADDDKAKSEQNSNAMPNALAKIMMFFKRLFG